MKFDSDIVLKQSGNSPKVLKELAHRLVIIAKYGNYSIQDILNDRIFKQQKTYKKRK